MTKLSQNIEANFKASITLRSLGDRRIAAQKIVPWCTRLQEKCLVICLPGDCLLEDCPPLNCPQTNCLLEDCSRSINYLLEDCPLENCPLWKVALTKFPTGKLSPPKKTPTGKLPTPPHKAFIFSFYITIRL